uniref:Uncharacterized protein n=1 Tax=Cucumis melo TaxID=3656 RepID=A0A9I9EMB8_CUCME
MRLVGSMSLLQNIERSKDEIITYSIWLAAPNHLNRVSKAALQMQRELLWFKFCLSNSKPKSNVMSSQRLEAKFNYPDAPKLTPRQVFTQEHKDLRKDGLRSG